MPRNDKDEALFRQPSIAGAILNGRRRVPSLWGDKAAAGIMDAMNTLDDENLDEFAKALMMGHARIDTGYGPKTLEGLRAMLQSGRTTPGG